MRDAGRVKLTASARIASYRNGRFLQIKWSSEEGEGQYVQLVVTGLAPDAFEYATSGMRDICKRVAAGELSKEAADVEKLKLKQGNMVKKPAAKKRPSAEKPGDLNKKVEEPDDEAREPDKEAEDADVETEGWGESNHDADGREDGQGLATSPHHSDTIHCICWRDLHPKK